MMLVGGKGGALFSRLREEGHDVVTGTGKGKGSAFGCVCFLFLDINKDDGSGGGVLFSRLWVGCCC